VSDKSLPSNWTFATMDDCLSFIRGVSFPKGAKSLDFEEGKVACLRTANVQKEVNWDDLWFIDNSRVKRAEQFVELGDILISTANSLELLGKSSLVKTLPYQSTLGTFIVNLRVGKLLNNKFIYYYLNTFPFLSEVRKQGSTTTNISNISVGKLEKFVLPIAPINEQHRIVEKIEELFSKLDSAVTELKNVKAQLKRYRQSVLKSAFEGRLTEEFRKANNYPNWQSLTLKELGIIKRGKSKHRPRNHPKLYGGIYPFIQTGDIRAANGKVIKEYTQTYSEEGLKQSKLWKKGTLCITIAANIGDTAILGFDACFPDSVVGFLPYKELSTSEFINYYFIYFKQNIENLAPATAQKNINVSILEKIEIHTPSVIEQQKIVEEIEARFSVADKIEEEIDRNLKKTEQLRQSILKQAFEGKLVPQDPNDPPASELLEQIKKERKKNEKL